MTPHKDVSLIDEGETAQAQHAPSVLDDAIERGIAELNAIRYQRDGEDNPIPNDRRLIERLYAAMFVAPSVPDKLCYDSRWEISIDYVDGWNAAVDMMRGKSPSWHCPDCCIAFPFGQPEQCPHDDVRCNGLLAASPESSPSADRAELPLSSDRADLAASIASAGKVAPDAFASWPRNVLEQLAADLYAFIQELGPHPLERLEQHARYEAALRTIAEYGCASKDWQLARDTLNGK